MAVHQSLRWGSEDILSTNETINGKGGESGTKELIIGKHYMTVRLTPKEYAGLIGHSEKYVRQWCVPRRMQEDENVLIEMRVPIADILDGCDKLTTISSQERRRISEHGQRRVRTADRSV